ncbi:hypothetical protein EDB92DRAFT_1885004 [Lactarius akahatsu]|uniref:Major facilitator superfamily (MFS) profile domain-containing protein n=1 Tax=Lactarius akahatsu TaxID=416441 RepID=A0AAD4LF45_9AGAM|nr:hypothetical protein EDB92DRAFT_1885004 [Lactarius akahatsu]
MTIWGLFATCAASLGPLVGGFAAHVVEGWRWTIWEIPWLSGLTLVLLFFFPEMSASSILYRLVKRLRRVTENPRLSRLPSSLQQP